MDYASSLRSTYFLIILTTLSERVFATITYRIYSKSIQCFASQLSKRNRQTAARVVTV